MNEIIVSVLYLNALGVETYKAVSTQWKNDNSMLKLTCNDGCDMYIPMRNVLYVKIK